MVMHPGQLQPTAGMVRSLVGQQFPEWSTLPVNEVVANGTVNALFRIGDELVARLPVQPADVDVARRELRAEAAAASELLGRTRFATPEPVALGEPGFGYPLPWSIQTWLPGTTADDADPSDSTEFAADLAEFIAGVRTIDTGGRRFSGGGRGGDLRSHDPSMKTYFEESEELLDVPRLRGIWATLRRLPAGRPDGMTQGDLIPGNVLVAEGRLTGVLDVGALGPADRALDLVGAWHLLDTDPRRVPRDRLGCDDLDWARGQAWVSRSGSG